MSKIKVLHTEWSDGWGGQEIRIVNEILALKEAGVESYIACRDHAQIKQKALEQNIKVFTLPFRGNVDLNTIFSLVKIVKQYDINIINTHSGKDTWVGGIASKLSGVKFIRTRHISNEINSNRLNFINEVADFIITTGETIKTNMIQNNRINPKKILSIPTGIDSDIFNSDNFNKIEIKDEYGFKNDEIIICIIAVLRGFKRHDTFLEVARKVIDEQKEKKLKFIIAGDGPMREDIIKNIQRLNLQSNVQMIGYEQNVAKLLSAIDIFLMTSSSGEGVPQSLMQALLMKKACISTDAGSIKDLWNNNNFLLVKHDVNEIKNALISLLENSSLKQELEFKARDYVLNNFSKNIMKKRVHEVYKKILDMKD